MWGLVVGKFFEQGREEVLFRSRPNAAATFSKPLTEGRSLRYCESFDGIEDGLFGAYDRRWRWRAAAVFILECFRVLGKGTAIVVGASDRRLLLRDRRVLGRSLFSGAFLRATTRGITAQDTEKVKRKEREKKKKRQAPLVANEGRDRGGKRGKRRN